MVYLSSGNNIFSFKNINYFKIIEDEKIPFIKSQVKLPLNKKLDVLNKYKDVKITLRDKEIFKGKVDYQNTIFSKNGNFLLIKGSSGLESILFDSMAKPASYINVTLYQIASIYLYPYGITKIDAPDNRMIPLFKVGLNESIWEVIKKFCEGIYGKTPYIENNTLIVREKINPKTHFFSNNSSDNKFYNYNTLEIISKQGMELSSVIVVDENNHETAYENKYGLYGLKKYISGNTIYNLVGRWSGKKEINKSIRDSFEIFLSTSSFLNINVKDEVFINDISSDKYEVKYVEKIFDKSIKTNLILCKKS